MSIAKEQIKLVSEKVKAACISIEKSEIPQRQMLVRIGRSYLNILDGYESLSDPKIYHAVRESERFCEVLDGIKVRTAGIVANKVLAGYWQVRMVALMQSLGFVIIDIAEYLMIHEPSMEKQDIDDANYVMASAASYSDNIAKLIQSPNQFISNNFSMINDLVCQTEDFVSSAMAMGFGVRPTNG